jgi:hypothetical protein
VEYPLAYGFWIGEFTKLDCLRLTSVCCSMPPARLSVSILAGVEDHALNPHHSTLSIKNSDELLIPGLKYLFDKRVG